MITLCMDTSHRYLTLVLIDENQVLAEVQQECFKKQSETILSELDHLCQGIGMSADQIDAICITRGPGSYTGVRIAMTVAKIMCSMRKIPLYTLSTLRLFSGNFDDCLVLLDARSQRAYRAVFKEGNLVGKEEVLPLNQIKDEIKEARIVLGDSELLGCEVVKIDYAKSFLHNRMYWHQEENVHTCVPEYLKENDDYLVKP